MGHKIVGIAAIKCVDYLNYIKILDENKYVTIDLTAVAREILKKEFDLKLELDQTPPFKEKIWSIYGKSHLAIKALTDWIPWVEIYGELEPNTLNYVISEITTKEEILYLRNKLKDKFTAVSILPPKDIMIPRFTAVYEYENQCTNKDVDEMLEASDHVFAEDKYLPTIRKNLKTAGLI